MIHIDKEILTREPDYEVQKLDFPYVKVEGREEFDILCPVSVITGHRTSLVEAILHLSNENMELANMVVETLEPTFSDERVSVSDRLDMVRERLSSGSFAENDGFLEHLSRFIELNYPDQPEVAAVAAAAVESAQAAVETPEPEPKQ